MQLNPTTMLVLILLFAIVFASYSARSLKNKILCTVNRADRTKIVKWAKIDQQRIDIEGGWYVVEPDRTVLRLWDSGIHWFFPVWVRCSDYRHGSARALDPNTFDNSYSAEARKELDTSDSIRAWSEGNRRALTGGIGKKGMLERYLPIIMIVGFLIVGYLVYNLQNHVNMLGVGQNTLEVQMGQILNKLPK